MSAKRSSVNSNSSITMDDQSVPAIMRRNNNDTQQEEQTTSNAVSSQENDPTENPRENHLDNDEEKEEEEEEEETSPALLDNADAPRLDLLETIQQGNIETVQAFLENNNDRELIANRHVVAATKTNNTELLRLVLTQRRAQHSCFAMMNHHHHAFFYHHHNHNLLHGNMRGWGFPDFFFPQVMLQSLQQEQQQRPLIAAAPPTNITTRYSAPHYNNYTSTFKALDMQPLVRRLAILRVLAQEAPQRLHVRNAAGQSALHYVVQESYLVVSGRRRQATSIRRRRAHAATTATTTTTDSSTSSSNGDNLVYPFLEQQEQDARNATLAFLLEHGGLNPNTADREGLTALHLAAQYNFQSTAALLVQQGGANPNAVTTKTRLTPLHYACNYGATETAAWLVKYGGSRPNTNPSMFHGLDLHQMPTCPRRMIEEWGMDPYCQQAGNETKETALHYLASLPLSSSYNPSLGRREWGVVQALLECQPDLVHATNASGQTALHVASSVQYMQLLCQQYGANPAVQDVRGNTALLHILQRFCSRSSDKDDNSNNQRKSKSNRYPTCRSQDYEMVMYLMTQMTAAQFNLPSHVEGWTALHLAAWHGHTDIVSYLLKVGRANPNVQTKHGGWTPLHVAHFPRPNVRASEPAMQRYYLQQHEQQEGRHSTPNDKLTRTKTVGLLLKHGANATVADAQGNLPFGLAAREGRLADTLAMMRVAAQQGLFEHFSKRTKN